MAVLGIYGGHWIIKYISSQIDPHFLQSKPDMVRICAVCKVILHKCNVFILFIL